VGAQQDQATDRSGERAASTSANKICDSRLQENCFNVTGRYISKEGVGCYAMERRLQRQCASATELGPRHVAHHGRCFAYLAYSLFGSRDTVRDPLTCCISEITDSDRRRVDLVGTGYPLGASQGRWLADAASGHIDPRLL